MKKVHGKKMRVTICHRVKPTHPATPGPTSAATIPPSQVPFKYLAGIAVDQQGNVYVTDFGNCRVVKLAPDGRFLMGFGSFTGCHPAESLGPYGVAVDSHGVVYVADTIDDLVHEYAPNGRHVRTLGRLGGGDGPGQFNLPTFIAVGPTGHVYVSDGYNDRIEIFSADGTFLKAFGHRGMGPGKFGGLVSGLAIDRQGNIYVGDHRNIRVEKFSPDGAFRTQWTVFNAPDGVAVDAAGNIYLQPPLQRIATGGSISPFGNILGNAVAIDAHGNVWATADVDRRSGLGKVEEFGPNGRLRASWDRPTGP
jgi:DNA-binding beta-propeller fold protein YncE